MRFDLFARLSAAFASSALIAACASGGSGFPAPPNSARASRDAGTMTAPTPTPTPIQLTLGGIVGSQQGWPDDDTAKGGQGQQVDGINCRMELLNSFHHHVHLSVFYNGTQLEIPKGLGMFKPGTNDFIYHAQCFYWLHSHDRTGIIHIEPPNGTLTFTLGKWFDLWGEPLTTSNIAGYLGSVAVYINGVLQPGMNPRTVVFSPFEQITLVIGTPPSWIPQYIFPPGYT